MGRMAMVEPGNAPDPLGRDRVRLYTYMVICSGAGVVVMIVVVTAPGVSEGRVTLCLFGVRFGRPS